MLYTEDLVCDGIGVEKKIYVENDVCDSMVADMFGVTKSQVVSKRMW